MVVTVLLELVVVGCFVVVVVVVVVLLGFSVLGCLVMGVTTVFGRDVPVDGCAEDEGRPTVWGVLLVFIEGLEVLPDGGAEGVPTAGRLVPPREGVTVVEGRETPVLGIDGVTVGRETPV